MQDGKLQQSLRFDELMSLLMSARHEILREKWAILYLLYSLSGSADANHSDTSAVVNVCSFKGFFCVYADFL